MPAFLRERARRKFGVAPCYPARAPPRPQELNSPPGRRTCDRSAGRSGGTWVPLRVSPGPRSAATHNSKVTSHTWTCLSQTGPGYSLSPLYWFFMRTFVERHMTRGGARSSQRTTAQRGAKRVRRPPQCALHRRESIKGGGGTRCLVPPARKSVGGARPPQGTDQSRRRNTHTRRACDCFM